MEAGHTSELPKPPSTNPGQSQFGYNKVTVNKSGFTILYDGSGRDGKDALVDIIFVHGLGGGPETTWSTSKSSTPPENRQAPLGSSTRRYLGRIWPKSTAEKSDIDSSQLRDSARAEDSSTGVKSEIFWPADFLPDAFPQVRILTWGYESKVTLFFSGTVNKGSYYSHAADLLYDVNGIRANRGRKRSIIWVAHSLGGIIVKEVLLRAQSDVGDDETLPLKDIYESTRGVIFLGTPHRGSSMAQWGVMAASLVKVAGFDTNATILKQLTSQSPELGYLRERFSVLLRRKDFHIRTFQEGEGMKGIRGLNGKVVDDYSSTIDDSESRRTIPANHMEMCKFSQITDIGYCHIKEDLDAIICQIQNMTRESMGTERGRLNSEPLRNAESVAQLQPIDLSESLLLDTSIFGNQYHLHNAIKEGDGPTVRRLLAKGAKIDEEDSFHEAGLSLAISSGNVEVVEILLNNGANIEERASFSMETPLIKATKLGSHVIVDFLLQQGADSQARDRSGNTALHMACKCGDEGVVNLLLQRGADIEAVDKSGKTSLHIVSELGNDNIAKVLLKSGANTEAKESTRQRTPLHYAAEKGNLAVIRHLLQSQARTNAQDTPFGKTALHLAAEHGHTDVVSHLISRGAAVNACLDTSCETALHMASTNGHDAVAKILVKEGANVTAKRYPNVDAKTPLHLAAQNGHHLVVGILCVGGALDEKELYDNTPLLLAAVGGHILAVEVLLGKGANIEAKNYEGLTALRLALKGGHSKLALLLLNEGASTAWPDARITALQYATSLGQISVVQRLLELGADVQETCEYGETALHCAASAGQTGIVSLLLASKAETDARNNLGCTALHHASRNGHGATVRLLLNCGATVTFSDSIGRTALHDAALRGHEDVVRLLIDARADCTAADKEIFGPLHLAASAGHVNVMLLLLRAGAVVDGLASRQRTPLSVACLNGHESAARVLLQEGAQVTSPEIFSPLHAAVMGGHLGVVDLLLSHCSSDGAISNVDVLLRAAHHGHAMVIKRLLNCAGFDINATGIGGLSALHFAATYGHDSAFQVLLEGGANIDQHSDMGWLPIHGAVLNGHTSTIRALLNVGSGVGCLQDIFTEDLSKLRRLDQEGLVRLFTEYGKATKRIYSSINNGEITSIRQQVTDKAIVNMRDGNGNTALHVAAVSSNGIEAIPVLCDIGVSVDTGNVIKQTALHAAVLKHNIEAQRLLLHHGADVNIRDYRGQTALYCAVRDQQEMSVKILVEAGADIAIKDDVGQMNALQYAEAQGYETIITLLSGRLAKDLEERLKV